MNVHEIGQATFDRFADDLLARLDKLDEKRRPLVWVPVGMSGVRVTQAIAKRAVAWPWAERLRVVPLCWNQERVKHEFQSDSDTDAVAECPVLLIDSVINSGVTLLGALDVLNELERSPRTITVYAVAARRSAEMVPNFFSISIGHNDRVFLPWHQQRPNNRLTPEGIFRGLREEDLGRPRMDCGQDFIDRVEWSDRWYSLKREQGRVTVVCELDSQIVSFINFTVDSLGGEAHVDEIAAGKSFTGRGFPGALLRYAETRARGAGCTRIALWSHESVIDYYAKLQFKPSGKKLQCGGEGSYFHMEAHLGSSKRELESWLRLREHNKKMTTGFREDR